jgi:hypothetical protein
MLSRGLGRKSRCSRRGRIAYFELTGAEEARRADARPNKETKPQAPATGNSPKR